LGDELAKVMRNPSTRQRYRDACDDDSLPVMVPRNDKPLVAVKPERSRRLREHLLRLIREARDKKHWARPVSTVLQEPAEFPATVARTACALCEGWCCRNGDDDGFLDGWTLARVRAAEPDMTDGKLLRLYLARVPADAYRDSCIFHGRRGCTLDRSLRADICNYYYCAGLGAYMKTEAITPITVIAGEGEKMRTSPVLTPQASSPSTLHDNEMSEKHRLRHHPG
jgi:hypothetical protein